ncbi:MAG TPA: trypsin-like peptidase domain-containing protein, partial [Actinomycetota bacterium]|nr:trypsin-like peptidase domain-containing protein [Actinomycetota bacterium]
MDGKRPGRGRRAALAAVAALLLAACAGQAVDLGLSGAAAPTTAASPLPAVTTEDRVVQVVKRVEPAVVSVIADVVGAGGQDRAVGTGFIVRQDGVIVTNYHVVETASRLTVVTTPPSPRRLEARVIGGDPDKDLAVLKVDAEGLATVPLGDSGGLQLGERVVAI